jgi:hypothetical protein
MKSFKYYLTAITPNWFLGVFVHKKNDPKHFPVERYTGMSVIGYKCHGCGYEWYEKRKRSKQ